jgi:hypothetical protein
LAEIVLLIDATAQGAETEKKEALMVGLRVARLSGASVV